MTSDFDAQDMGLFLDEAEEQSKYWMNPSLF